MEPPWEGGVKVCINSPGHMTKMAATPIYGKNLKILLQNRRFYDLETNGMQQCLGLKLYKVYINGDPWLTLTFLQQGQIWSPVH